MKREQFFHSLQFNDDASTFKAASTKRGVDRAYGAENALGDRQVQCQVFASVSSAVL